MTKELVPPRLCADCGCAIPPPAIGAGNSGVVCLWCLMKRRDRRFGVQQLLNQ
jgi:hypothetical protein